MSEKESYPSEESSATPGLIQSKFAVGGAFREQSPLVILLALLGIIIAGSVVDFILMVVLAFAVNADVSGLVGGDMTSLLGTPELTRWVVAINHLTTFVLPAVFVLWIFYRGYRDQSGKGWMHYVGAALSPNALSLVLGILLSLASLPLVQYLYTVNKMLPMPEIFHDMENSTAELLKGILQNMTPLGFLANVIIIALIPAIGEELVFRGLLQRQLLRWLRNPWAAIILAGAIFSFIHLQFEGFLSRWALGIVLGWLYWRSGNIWVSIVAHFFNNAFMVAGVYFVGGEFFDVENEADVEVPIWAACISLFLMAVIVRFFIQKVPRQALQEDTYGVQNGGLLP